MMLERYNYSSVQRYSLFLGESLSIEDKLSKHVKEEPIVRSKMFPPPNEL